MFACRFYFYFFLFSCQGGEDAPVIKNHVRLMLRSKAKDY